MSMHTTYMKQKYTVLVGNGLMGQSSNEYILPFAIKPQQQDYFRFFREKSL